jgi:hypothetical protein
VAFGRAFCSCSSSSSSPSGLPTTLTSSRSSFGTCHIIGETDNKNGKGMGVVIRFSALGSGYADVAMHSTGFAVIDTPPSCTHSPTSGLFPPWTGSLTHPLVAEVLLLENTPHVLLNTYVEQLLFFFFYLTCGITCRFELLEVPVSRTPIPPVDGVGFRLYVLQATT